MARRGNGPARETEDKIDPVEDEVLDTPVSEPVKAKDQGAKYLVSELLGLTSQLIPDVERHFAVGAMRYAGVSDDDQMTTDDFKQKVEAFRNARAF